MTETVEKAIHYGIVLNLANFSKKKLAAIDQLQELIMSADYSLFQYKMTRQFNVDSALIDSLKVKLEKAYKPHLNKCKILPVWDDKYPKLLSSVNTPPMFLFCRGDIKLFADKTVAVVENRAATPENLRRTNKLARLLTRQGYTVVSGLAKGIDASAHTGAIEEGGKTISVIGTPLDKSYPKENQHLQEQIAKEHLLVSQFHFGHPVNRACFPARNHTMSGISHATIVVEAGETSGTLIQARQCIAQGRHLFLLKSLLDRADLAWPKKYIKKGAFVVSSIDDVTNALSQAPEHRRPFQENTLFE